MRPGVLEITIREGRNHQVKRMCEAVGHRVRTLQRVRFGSLRLDDLPEGAHRRLRGSEVEGLRRSDWASAPDDDAQSPRRVGHRAKRSATH